MTLLWNVVGFVMGVHEGLMAHTPDDAAVLFALLKSRLRGPSEEGTWLTRGLVEWMNSLLPPWLRWFDAGSELIIFLNGDDDAARLGTRPPRTPSPTPLCHALERAQRGGEHSMHDAVHGLPRGRRHDPGSW